MHLGKTPCCGATWGMPKNRDYTGLVRTPSSMAWLIGHRARIKGQLDRLRRLEATLPEKIKSVQAELAAIDAVIPLHEVKVDPKLIKGIRPQGPRTGESGQLTRSILAQLRVQAGKPLYTSEIALHFVRQHNINVEQLGGHSELMDRVGKRLGELVAKGWVRRHHAKTTTGPGSWSLVLDADEQLIESEAA
jgi:hypothetical protein